MLSADAGLLVEEVMGGVEPWWMVRWKALAEFLLSVIERLFLCLTVEALQGKMCQNSLPSGVGRSLGAKISGEMVVPGEYFLVSTKLDTFCYPTMQTAPCYVPSSSMWEKFASTHRSRDTAHAQWLQTHCQWYPMGDVKT